jgi:2'-5' RNA ligase
LGSVGCRCRQVTADTSWMVTAESAVLVAVPEAEALVGRFRAELDRSARWGVPPHVTVIYPFVDPDLIDHRVVDRLAGAIASVPAFEVTFSQVAWFGQSLLWLAPEPSGPFVALTEAVWTRFPRHAPYGGTLPNPIPHLTVGRDAPFDVLRRAARAIQPQLPIQTRVASVRLMHGTAETGSWQTIAELPLAPGDRS